MEYAYDICRLSREFYEAYPREKYPEIMRKDGRPYTCLLIETKDDYFICIPFRSSINHGDAFLFKTTERSRKSRAGLDYRKIVLIRDHAYIDDKKMIIDRDEYAVMRANLPKIAAQADEYIERYKCHADGTKVLHHREFMRHYQYTTLKYFHDILGIKKR